MLRCIHINNLQYVWLYNVNAYIFQVVCHTIERERERDMGERERERYI